MGNSRTESTGYDSICRGDIPADQAWGMYDVHPADIGPDDTGNMDRMNHAAVNNSSGQPAYPGEVWDDKWHEQLIDPKVGLAEVCFMLCCIHPCLHKKNKLIHQYITSASYFLIIHQVFCNLTNILINGYQIMISGTGEFPNIRQERRWGSRFRRVALAVDTTKRSTHI